MSHRKLLLPRVAFLGVLSSWVFCHSYVSTVSTAQPTPYSRAHGCIITDSLEAETTARHVGSKKGPWRGFCVPEGTQAASTQDPGNVTCPLRSKRSWMETYSSLLTVSLLIYKVIIELQLSGEHIPAWGAHLKRGEHIPTWGAHPKRGEHMPSVGSTSPVWGAHAQRGGGPGFVASTGDSYIMAP